MLHLSSHCIKLNMKEKQSKLCVDVKVYLPLCWLIETQGINSILFFSMKFIKKTQLLILLKGRVPHLLFFDIKLHIIWKKDSKNYFNMNRYITTHIRHIHGSWLKLGVKFVCYLTSRQVLNVKIKLFSIILHTLIVPKLHLHGVVVTDGSSLQVEKHGKQRWSEMFARKHCHVELNVFNIKCLTVS